MTKLCCLCSRQIDAHGASVCDECLAEVLDHVDNLLTSRRGNIGYSKVKKLVRDLRKRLKGE